MKFVDQSNNFDPNPNNAVAVEIENLQLFLTELNGAIHSVSKEDLLENIKQLCANKNDDTSSNNIIKYLNEQYDSFEMIENKAAIVIKNIWNNTVNKNMKEELKVLYQNMVPEAKDERREWEADYFADYIDKMIVNPQSMEDEDLENINGIWRLLKKRYLLSLVKSKLEKGKKVDNMHESEFNNALEKDLKKVLLDYRLSKYIMNKMRPFEIIDKESLKKKK